MEKVELNKEDLMKAYKGGCDDVRRVLERMYPGILLEYCCGSFEVLMKKFNGVEIIHTGSYWRVQAINNHEGVMIYFCPFCGKKL